MNRKKTYIGLVHHPVIDKFGNIITTSITNMDIHDISRTARTFDMAGYFIINPLESQYLFLERVLKFWNTKIAKEYNGDRVEALSLVKFAYTIENCINEIKRQENDLPIIVTTTANERDYQIGFEELKKKNFEKPLLILFGTGNGLSEQVHMRADFILEPIKGFNFNHLSVRSAVAIILDRLFAEK
jgi:hypothetical protein